MLQLILCDYDSFSLASITIKNFMASQQNLLKFLYWFLFVSTIVTFWISLRSDSHALEYSLAALALWASTYGLHRVIKSKSSARD